MRLRNRWPVTLLCLWMSLMLLSCLPALAEELLPDVTAPATDTELPPEAEPEQDPGEGAGATDPEAPSDETPALPDEDAGDGTPEAGPEAPEEDLSSEETEEEELWEARGDTFSVELHTGAAYGGSGAKLNAGKAISSVSLTKAAKKLCELGAVSGKTFRLWPLKTGSARFTLYFTDGTKQTCTLEVYDKYVASSLKLSFTSCQDGATLLMKTSGQTVRTTCSLTPSTAKDTVTYKSSNRRVATVDASTGVITLLKEGTFYLTARASGGASVRVKLKVADPYAVSSLTILYNGTVPTAKTTLWSTGDRLKLSWRAVTYGGSGYPADSSSFTWSTSSRKIAEIAQDGTVTVHKAGTVTFTLKCSHGGKAAIRMRFAPPLQSISMGSGTVTEVRPGRTVKLKATLNPSGSSPLVQLTWYSANEKIAKVSSKGVVTGVSEGTTWIYCKDTASGLYARRSVVVSIPPTYRAVVAVEPTDIEDLAWRESGVTWYLNGYMKRTTDLNGIVKTLKLQSYNGHRWSVSQLWKSSPAKVKAAIARVAAKANEHDITLFFFMGHGDSKGGLYFYNGSHITAAELKSWLDAVPGRVIVMLGSCYSGTYISRSGGSASDFTSSVISAFGVGDTVPVTFVDERGEVTSVTGDMLAKALDDSDGSGYTGRSGELRQSKYYVLTAAASGQQAWSAVTIKKINYSRYSFTTDEGASYSYFVRGVCRAGGWDPVDKTRLWSSGSRTLSQVYSTVAQYCSSGSSTSKVQVYPSGSSFVIFQQ